MQDSSNASHEEDIQRIRVGPWFEGRFDDSLRLDYALDRSSIVFDVGGYRGEWSYNIFSRYRCRTLVFEPVPDFARSIQKRFAGNPMVEVYQFGLGSETARTNMTLSGDASSTKRKGSVKIHVRMQRASDFLKKHGIDRVDLMKINIEGGEFELLEHLTATDWIERIGNIQVQFHSFMPDAEERMKRIQATISRTHYLTYQYEFVWENWTLKPRPKTVGAALAYNVALESDLCKCWKELRAARRTNTQLCLRLESLEKELRVKERRLGKIEALPLFHTMEAIWRFLRPERPRREGKTGSV